ncbi:hypothetical protein OIU77_015675 [Salix suchowensis]|uniref:F-box domain-containing protein n=1 Tax=Salix suchowensis TaxID=1278906 RepID=A0ABQ8ZI32_9ROSI|nr:hypothetical protein OIU77_015675 [Salix suchowensis]
MAMSLKKVWESVTNRRSSCSSSHVDSVITPQSYTESTPPPPPPPPLGAFDRLPICVVFQIVKLVGPNEAARLSVVCKSWRSLVSDDRLWMYFLQSYHHDTWNSVFFAETNLQKFSCHIAKSSFMRIYRQRVHVPGAVIVDVTLLEVVLAITSLAGANMLALSGRSATFSEFINIESPSYFRFRNFFASIYSRMQVKASTQPIVLSLPLRNDDVLHGKVMRTMGVEVVDVGGLKLTEFLREQMQQSNMNLRSLFTVRILKEKLCYVAADYENELSKDIPASLEVPGEGWFTLSKERFTTGEVLFQPHIAGVHTKGLHEAVALCMDHCHVVESTGDDAWFKSVVLSGGTACLPGLVGLKKVNVRVSSA